MKKQFGRLRREITRVLRWILRNQSLLRFVLRLGVWIYNLLRHLDK